MQPYKLPNVGGVSVRLMGSSDEHGEILSRFLHHSAPSNLKRAAQNMERLMVKRLTRGDLVIWAPSGKPGLWEVQAVRHQEVLVDADYSQLELRILAQSGISLPPVPSSRTSSAADLPIGRARIKWIGGWHGYAGHDTYVVVKIEDLRLANEMEALALAAFGE